MEKECCRCGNYKAYYSRAYCCYLKEDFGWCASKKQIVNKHDSCENRISPKTNTRLKYGVIMQNLDEAITNISIIKDFLEERIEK